MNRRSGLTVALIACAVGLVYALIVLQNDGVLQDAWAVLTSGSFGGFPL